MSIQVGMPENYEEKTICCFVVDRSGSMEGDPIRELNQGLQEFYQDIENSSKLKDGLEVAIIAFDSKVEVVQLPALIHNFQIPTLVASGLTALNTAVKEAIRVVEERKDYYKQTNQSYKRPWIILITDGAPTDGDVSDLAVQVATETQAKKYVFLPIGVNGADMDILNQISGYFYMNNQWTQRPAMRMSSEKFSQFFEWLSASMEIIGASNEGDTVNLPSVEEWTFSI